MQSIAQIIATWFENIPEKKRLPKLYPSAAGLTYDDPLLKLRLNDGGCRKSEFLRLTSMRYPGAIPEQPRTDAQRVTDAANNMKAEMGNMVHELVATALKKSGNLVGEEVRMGWPEYNVSGRVDLVFRDPDSKRIRIGEVKSKSLYGTAMVMEPDRAGRYQPTIDAVSQSLTYLLWINRWLPAASDEQLREVCRNWDGEQFTFDEHSYKVWLEVRESQASGMAVNTCEVAYVCRDNLDRKSHFINLTKDNRVALLNEQYTAPIYLPYDPDSVLQHYSDVNQACAVMELKLQTARDQGVGDMSVAKFHDLVRACAPADDFTVEYDAVRIDAIYKAGLMTKTDAKAFAAGNKLTGKYWDRQCEYCDYITFCKGTEFNR